MQKRSRGSPKGKLAQVQEMSEAKESDQMTAFHKNHMNNMNNMNMNINRAQMMKTEEFQIPNTLNNQIIEIKGDSLNEFISPLKRVKF